MRIVVLSALALFVMGCGTDLVVTTLAEARATCEAWVPGTDAEWHATLIAFEAMRDDGVSKGTAVGFAMDACRTYELELQSGCFTCETALIDVVWQRR